MSNIKYTTDGRKVAIIGKLNNQETIVQEIFVTGDGSEIPAGENFVVKSLLDAPARSWKEKDLADWEARYDRDKARYVEDIKRLERSRAELRVKLNDVIAALKTDQTAALQHFADVVAGQFQWVVEKDYGVPKLYSIDHLGEVDHENWGAQLKALTVWGKTKGDWLFRLNHYSDGSGSGRDVYFFKTKDEALAKMKEILLSCSYIDDEAIELAKKYGWELPADKVKEFYQKRYTAAVDNLAKVNKDITRYADNVTDARAKLQELGIELPEEDKSEKVF
jgi:hypothetical protein